ncbi:MAG: hypothetical protein EZS28_030066 [Streblomastix strix]|uniref:Uncharacterized protein n=1 Tax=Streblomastix strix TaxID=222440 RepID=A0A5J4UVB2_9EUKA|nr:MAG: hypothetical protein EZS28_030066 [Streblomastix strix]
MYVQHPGSAVGSRQEMKKIETKRFGGDLRIRKFLPMSTSPKQEQQSKRLTEHPDIKMDLAQQQYICFL